MWVADGTGFKGCGNYPVRVEGDEGGHLELTPSGPGGERVAGYFANAGEGDTSGWWRWTIPPRDGVPQAWVHLNRNSPRSGGMADLRVVLDDAAVDGDVSAVLTVEAGDGAVATFDLAQVDQHCEDDGFVELAVPDDTRDSKIDGLGPYPYEYDVELRLDGEEYDGVGTWTGQGTQYGGDAVLAFEPGLPARG
jgi:hypothetical protein